MSDAVADPGLSQTGAPTPQFGQNTIIWQDFCRQLHENEINRTEGECTSLAPPWTRQCGG